MQLLGFAHTSQLFINSHGVLGSEEDSDIPNPTQGRLCHSTDLRHCVLVMAVPVSTVHIYSGLPQFPTPCLERLRQRKILAFGRTHPISYSGLPTGMQRDLSSNLQCPVVTHTCHPVLQGRRQDGHRPTQLQPNITFRETLSRRTKTGSDRRHPMS